MASGRFNSAAGVPAKPTPEALLDKLDELLKNCTPKEVEHPYGEYYAKCLDELKKVR